MSTFTCTITIDKDAGILLVVEDKDNSRKQSINMTGEAIICTVQGEKTSTITQKHNQITIDVENFVITADTVAVTAKKTIDLKTESDNFTLKSGKDLTIEASAKCGLTCADADVKASSSSKQSSPTISVSADTKLDLKSAAAAAFEGAQISVKGSATVAIEASGMTEIKGSAITASAPMIKLG